MSYRRPPGPRPPMPAALAQRLGLSSPSPSPASTEAESSYSCLNAESPPFSEVILGKNGETQYGILLICLYLCDVIYSPLFVSLI